MIKNRTHWKGMLTVVLVGAIQLCSVASAQEMPLVQLGFAVQNPAAADREERAKRWIRGLIQQEFHVIKNLCKPDAEQTQKLLDLAEKEWKFRLVTSIKAYSEAANRNTVDFESRVERVVSTWISETLSEEQGKAWLQELESRTEVRKRLVIGKMVCEAERRFGLTAKQMREVQGILQERYRESWWTMHRTGTIPETKFAWISSTLSDSQRTAGGDRNNSRRVEHFTSGQPIDLPSRSLQDRFELAGWTSKATIPLEKSPVDGDEAAKAALDEDDVFGPADGGVQVMPRMIIK